MARGVDAPAPPATATGQVGVSSAALDAPLEVDLTHETTILEVVLAGDQARRLVLAYTFADTAPGGDHATIETCVRRVRPGVDASLPHPLPHALRMDMGARAQLRVLLCYEELPAGEARGYRLTAQQFGAVRVGRVIAARLVVQAIPLDAGSPDVEALVTDAAAAAARLGGSRW